jgi:hypothetical protein
MTSLIKIINVFENGSMNVELNRDFENYEEVKYWARQIDFAFDNYLKEKKAHTYFYDERGIVKENKK